MSNHVDQNERLAGALCADGSRNDHVDIATGNHTFTDAHFTCTAVSPAE